MARNLKNKSISPFWWLRRRHRHRMNEPVARAAWPDLVQWDWIFPDPFKWNVWMSLNDGVSWTLLEDYWAWGNAREFSPDGGSELYYVVGVNEAGEEVTWHSNVICPDDGVAPALPLGTDLLAYWTLDQGAGLDRADASGNGQPLSDYDALGQWTDETIRGLILARYGLELAT